ncbi:hypothetical protein LWF01_14995 [Saxibacter everestensis]|uniref:Uncharacterized protein n=1 Tax=Saxibacter everestensis TaxID=2909229 RepID=A0ABY8QQX4_9MICO|nr:hypothetical protein LWF01_14995 [Brevibacteriaceae bacterium ZFBP1038]
MSQRDDIEVRISAARDGVRKHEKLTSELERLQLRLDEAECELLDKLNVAQVGDAEAERLTSFSGDRMWSVFSGSKGSDSERQTAEGEAAKGIAAEAKARRDALAQEVETIQREIRDLGDVESELDHAVHQKEQYLVEEGSPQSDHILELAGQKGELTAELRELDDAIATGSSTIEALDELVDDLQEASQWTIYDSYPGGSLLTSSLKHEHVDKTVSLAKLADLRLAQFSRKLVGVSGEIHGASLAMEHSQRFLDTWFDNILADVSVAGHIKDALTKAVKARDAVRERIEVCVERRHKTSGQLKELEAARAALMSRT